jgi:hypothetical protein
MVITDAATIGVDVPKEIEIVEEILTGDEIMKLYLTQ